MSSDGQKKRPLDTPEEPAKKKAMLQRTYTRTQLDGKQGTRLTKISDIDPKLYKRAQRRKRSIRRKEEAKQKKEEAKKKKAPKKVPAQSDEKDDLDDAPDLIDMCKRFDGYVVVITGAGSGIGQDCAVRFAREGAAVVVVIDKKRFRDTIDLVEKHKGKAVGYQKNVNDIDGIKAILAEVVTKYDRIDVLVNCVSRTGLVTKQAHADSADLQTTMDINYMGTMNCCNAALSYMVKEEFGRIVNVVSIIGVSGDTKFCAFAASNAAVIAATKCLGKQFATSGITINAVGVLAVESILATKKMVERSAAKRPCSVAEVTATISWLACEENSFSTGTCYDMSGGSL